MTPTYSKIKISQAKIIKNFPMISRRGRLWQNYSCNGKVLNFGSGNVNNSAHREIKHAFENVVSCDSDSLSGADYNNIYQIEDKFDLIIGEHILEHITVDDIINSLSKKFYNLLNDNGKLLLTIPNINNFGSYFTNFDHKNSSPPIDIASIICCKGFEVIDFFRWSKINQMERQLHMNDFEIKLAEFMKIHYDLEIDKYITMVFQKSG